VAVSIDQSWTGNAAKGNGQTAFRFLQTYTRCGRWGSSCTLL
jgi:hypothetical protein